MSLSRNVKDVMGIVHSLRDEMEGDQRGLVNLKEEMSSKMDEGFKIEQHARQQIQSGIVQGFNNEESARQLVQKDVAVMKDDIKKTQDGWWQYDVQRGHRTFARPAPLTSRWNEIFIARKMEFKGWGHWVLLRVTFKVSQTKKLRNFWSILSVVPQQAQKWIDWDQTKKE